MSVMTFNATLVGTGYCTGTVEGWQGDCTNGHVGSSPITRSSSHAECIERCRRCAQCTFVSVSLKNEDCSWYSGCATGSLSLVYGGSSYTTYRVKNRQMACHGGRSRAQLVPSARARQVSPAASSGVHMVTFYSEGPPRDQGIPLGAMAGILEAAFAPHVESFRAYTPSTVRSLAIDWTDTSGRRQQLSGARTVAPSQVEASMNTGMGAIGHLAAKPFVILLRLLELAPGAVLVFKDANVNKRPKLLGGAAQLADVARFALAEAAPPQDVLIPFENGKWKLKHHCKAYAIRELAPRDRWEQLFEAPLHYSCQVIATDGPLIASSLLSKRRCTNTNPDPHPHPNSSQV